MTNQQQQTLAERIARCIDFTADRPEAKDAIQAVLAADEGLAEVEAALRPFMPFVACIDGFRHEEDSTCLHKIKASDLRTLRKALTALRRIREGNPKD
jgi:hypothetical protein